jgi:hypothetical protein
MIVEKLMQKCPFQSQVLRAIAGGIVAAVIVSVAVVVVSSLAGYPCEPAVVAALATVAGASYVVKHRRA